MILTRRTDTAAQLLCSVLIAIVSALVLLPLGYLFYGAIRSVPPGAPDGGFTFANLQQIYGSLAFVEPLVTTLAIGIAVGSASAAVGLALAWTVTRLDIPKPDL